MRHFTACLAVVLIGALAAPVRAESTITWAAGFPLPGDAPGQIKGEGVVKPDDKASSIMSVEVETWQDGMEVTKHMGTATRRPDGTFEWKFTAKGLVAGATYNVIVVAVIRSCGALEKICTAPKTVKVK